MFKNYLRTALYFLCYKGIFGVGIGCSSNCLSNRLVCYAQMVRKFCVPNRYQLMGICSTGHCFIIDRIDHGKFSIDQSSQDKPGKELENRIEQFVVRCLWFVVH